MTTVEFLARLHARDVRVWVDGDNLRCRAPKGALTAELRDQLAERKGEILALLQGHDSVKRSVVPVNRVPRSGSLPLSFSQERLWFLHQVEPRSSAYTIVSAVRFKRRLDVPDVQRSLDRLLQRHETLRTTFATLDGEPVLRIAPAMSVNLPVFDLKGLEIPERRQRFARIRTELIEQPFDLERGPLMRVAIIHIADDDWVLLFALHHIISDRWSLGVLTNEFEALYTAASAGENLALPELPIQYVDFSAWQRERLQGRLMEGQLTYWREQLGGELPVIDLPLDRPRPAEQTHRGAWESRQLPADMTGRINEMAKAASATPFMVFLAGFGALLHRYTGQHDILIGSPITGRTNQQLEGLVGCFLNMLVLRADLSGSPTFSQLLGRIREVALGAYSHAEVPFEKLVEDLHPRRDPSRSPLFQVAISFQNAPKSVEVTPDVSFTASGGTLFDLTLFVTEIQNHFVITAEYNVDLFERSTIARMLAHFDTLLTAAIGQPDRAVATLPMLTGEEREQILNVWNNTAAAFDAASCVHELVEAQAARTPEAIAVQCEDRTLTYADLNARANQLAHHLRRQGVGPETPIGIAVERSLDMLVGLLGIHKAGAAYVPLDPSYPAERLAYMIKDAGVSILITQEGLLGHLPTGNARVMCLDRDWTAISQEPAGNPSRTVSGENLAYIIYTSGSTGLPKGVQVPHRGVVNLLSSMVKTPGLGPDDVLVSVTTLSFDIAGLELFLPLVTGARVVIASREEVTEGGSLLARLQSVSATVMQATPATWRLLLEAGWTGGLKKMFCGGEALPRDLASTLSSLKGELWNLYGPTETTIWSTAERIADAEQISIGRPIDNTQVFILDAALQPLPVGVAGEAYIAGSGVARGYRQRPDLTAERFVPCPFGPAGSRMYWTGDIARYLPDGRLECLGRVDHQVKVRGFRIELDEIESVMNAHPAIREALVLAEEAAPGDLRLVAYIVYLPGESLTASELRRFVRTSLPEYMVPSFFMKLDQIPRTLNNKIDRRSLPNAFKGSTHEAERMPPTTATERRIAEIWKKALSLTSVSAEDNFFDIGGHSLLSMRVLAEMERTVGHRPGPRAMFMENLKQIAEWCDRRSMASDRPAAAEGVGAGTTAAYGLS
jgi:amino acid adenylation domain-containing protein